MTPYFRLHWQAHIDTQTLIHMREGGIYREKERKRNLPFRIFLPSAFILYSLFMVTVG